MFRSVVLPMMVPGLVTIFLFQFVAIWNNFMLPFVMLGDDKLFPVTVGLSGLLNQGAQQPALYTLVITGACCRSCPCSRCSSCCSGSGRSTSLPVR